VTPLNILFVTEHIPYPDVPHAGGQDYWHLIDALRARHRVYVATFDDPAAPIPTEKLAPYVEKLHIVRDPLPPALKTRLKARLSASTSSPSDAAMPAPRSLLSSTARIIRQTQRAWMATQMERVVRAWCDRYQIDVLHCAWTAMGRYLTASPHALFRVLDEVDVRFLVEADETTRGLRDPADAARRKADELASCAAADLVIARSKYDLDVLQAHVPTLQGFVLHSVGDVRRLLDVTPDEATPNRILFCGAFDRDANIDAAQWFARAIFPLIRANVPAAELWLVGARQDARVRELAALAGVTVTGYVPDLRPYHAAARVVIAPTRVPAGNLIKIMDGLAAGRPVVATTIANRGIAAPSVRTADTPDAFATHIVTLLRDDTAWRADCAINRAYARSHFDWDANVARLETLYMDGVQRIRTEGRNVPRPSES